MFNCLKVPFLSATIRSKVHARTRPSGLEPRRCTVSSGKKSFALFVHTRYGLHIRALPVLLLRQDVADISSARRCPLVSN